MNKRRAWELIGLVVLLLLMVAVGMVSSARAHDPRDIRLTVVPVTTAPAGACDTAQAPVQLDKTDGQHYCCAAATWAACNPPGGGGTFLGLSDTPGSFAGGSGQSAVVNALENALEFADRMTLDTQQDVTGGKIFRVDHFVDGQDGARVLFGDFENQGTAGSRLCYFFWNEATQEMRLDCGSDTAQRLLINNGDVEIGTSKDYRAGETGGLFIEWSGGANSIRVRRDSCGDGATCGTPPTEMLGVDAPVRAEGLYIGVRDHNNLAYTGGRNILNREAGFDPGGTLPGAGTSHGIARLTIQPDPNSGSAGFYVETEDQQGHITLDCVNANIPAGATVTFDDLDNSDWTGAVVLTEGVEWTKGGTDDITCDNLRTAIDADATLGPLMTGATGVGNMEDITDDVASSRSRDWTTVTSAPTGVVVGNVTGSDAWLGGQDQRDIQWFQVSSPWQGSIGTDETGSLFQLRTETFELGPNSDVTIGLYARNGDANKPGVRYNAATNSWQIANDGATWEDVATYPIEAGDLPVGLKGEQLTVNEAETALEFSLASKYLPVRKGSAGTISAGAPVYISGYNVGGWVEVEESDADNPATMPAVGLAFDSLTNSSTDRVLLVGNFTDIDTSAWSEGDELWVDTTPGQLTSVKPTGTAQIQKVGIVGRAHAVNGQLVVLSAGRANDVPNLATGNIWRGDGSGVAQPVSLASDADLDAMIGETVLTEQDDAEMGAGVYHGFNVGAVGDDTVATVPIQIEDTTGAPTSLIKLFDDGKDVGDGILYIFRPGACNGGARDGTGIPAMCFNDSECPGNSGCFAAGYPNACCTGAGTGSCTAGTCEQDAVAYDSQKLYARFGAMFPDGTAQLVDESIRLDPFGLSIPDMDGETLFQVLRTYDNVEMSMRSKGPGSAAITLNHCGDVVRPGDDVKPPTALNCPTTTQGLIIRPGEISWPIENVTLDATAANLLYTNFDFGVGRDLTVDGSNGLTLGSPLTDLTIKSSRIFGRAYDNGQASVVMLHMSSQSAVNNPSFGGGTALGQWATRLSFHVAGGVNQTTGNEVLRVEGAGSDRAIIKDALFAIGDTHTVSGLDCLDADPANDRIYYNADCDPPGSTPDAGEPYLDQFGVTIDDTEMTAESFGDFTCSGAEDGCTLDAGAVDALAEIDGALCGTNEILEDQGASWGCIATPAGGAEVNNLETTDPPNVLDNEVYVGTGAAAGAWTALQDCTDGTQSLDWNGTAFVCNAITDNNTQCDDITCDLADDTANTEAADNNTTQLATTAFVQQEINGAGGQGLTCSGGSCDVAKQTECFTLFDSSGLADTDDVPSVWRAPAAATITEVWCETDGGSPSINLQRDDGTPANVCTSNLTCTTGGATCTVAAAEDNFADGDRLDFVMVSASTANRVNVCTEYTLD